MRALITILLFYALMWTYLLIDENRFVKVHHLFPFYNGSMEQIRLQSAIDYGITRLVYCAFVFIIWRYAPDSEKIYFAITFWLFIGFFIDYCLGYNNPYGYLVQGKFVRIKPDGWFLPLSYPLFMGFSLTILACLRVLKSLLYQ